MYCAVRSTRPTVCNKRSYGLSLAASAAIKQNGASARPASQQVSRVRLKTRSDCELGISIYPDFRYNAVGGGGWGTVRDAGDGKLAMWFDTELLVIPDLSFRTLSMLGLPMPPPFNIAIKPLRLEGTYDTRSGEVTLEFDANFMATAGAFYAAPPMRVCTRLSTEEVAGEHRKGHGARVVGSSVRLAGVAQVEKTGDLLVDSILLLPQDALAVMAAEFEFA